MGSRPSHSQPCPLLYTPVGECEVAAILWIPGFWDSSCFKDWILFIAERDSIDPRKGLVELIHKIGAFKAFDKCDPQMCLEQKGLWLHTNVVRGKVDLFPQQDLVDMLISL